MNNQIAKREGFVAKQAPRNRGKALYFNNAGMAESVDARDLKVLALSEIAAENCKTHQIGPAELATNLGILQNKPAVHFVRFDNLYDQHFWNAVRVFGAPDFLHRFWDRRALREIDENDIVLFAKGDAEQPFTDFNGNDEAYE